MTYKLEELDFKNYKEEEQARTRVIFEDLKTKANDNEELSEHEADFFCQSVRLSLKDDGKITDYDCCSNHLFKNTFLVYFYDLSGNGKYEKPKGTSLYNPDKNEIQKDIDYLRNVAVDWLTIVTKTNHAQELLKQISKEARNDLKGIEKSKGKLLFRRDKERYILDRRKVLLQTKFIYCTALLIFEMFDNKEFILILNGKDIEMNEYSIVHILNRHYSEMMKPNPQKSFHTEVFKPKYLNKQIGNIFKQIDESGFFINQSINHIAFRFNNMDYHIWINQQTKQIKGKGNVQYNRLETFYPITDIVELNDLNENFELKEIDADLSIYIFKE